MLAFTAQLSDEDDWPAYLGGSEMNHYSVVYAPTGSAAPDFFGGSRKGSNLFASTLLALDVNTAKRIWHYQLVKHDIWDRDISSPPN